MVICRFPCVTAFCSHNTPARRRKCCSIASPLKMKQVQLRRWEGRGLHERLRLEMMTNVDGTDAIWHVCREWCSLFDRLRTHGVVSQPVMDDSWCGLCQHVRVVALRRDVLDKNDSSLVVIAHKMVAQLNVLCLG